ncbi:MAG: electron transfer flavoprotein subunit beta/FixA family protein [Anaerolineales bacterium]
MHVVVITKSTPDTAAKVSVNAEGQVGWGESMVINPWDEYAVTEAVLIKEAHNAKATVMTLGAEAHAEALKQGLAIGCDAAVRVWDAGLHPEDSLQYSRAMAAAVQKLDDVQLVIFGKEFADLGSDQHVYQVGRKLGWTVLGSVAKILALDFEAKTIQVERWLEQGTQVVKAPLPAVVSVLKDINEPKYPSFMGIRKAAKADIPVWDATALGVDVGSPATQILSYENPPQKSGAVTMIEGDSPASLAENLANKLMEDKVL